MAGARLGSDRLGLFGLGTASGATLFAATATETATAQAADYSIAVFSAATALINPIAVAPDPAGPGGGGIFPIVWGELP